MSFDKFLLAVESCDLSQADKGIIRGSSFPIQFLNDKIGITVNHIIQKIEVLQY